MEIIEFGIRLFASGLIMTFSAILYSFSTDGLETNKFVNYLEKIASICLLIGGLLFIWYLKK